MKIFSKQHALVIIKAAIIQMGFTKTYHISSEEIQRTLNIY